MSSAPENTSDECDGKYDLIFLEQTLKEFKDQENYVTVKMLKQMLAGLPNNMPVILSKDTGGNRNSTLGGVDTRCFYLPAGQQGDVFDVDETAENNCMNNECMNFIRQEENQCIVLFPVR
jgi:hypothetical protein